MSPVIVGVLVAAAVASLVGSVASVPTTLTARRTQHRARALAGPPAHRPALPGHRARWAPPASRLRAALGRHDPRVARRVDQVLAPLLEAVSRELRAGVSLRAALLVAAADLDHRWPGADPGAAALVVSLQRGAPFAAAVVGWVEALPTASRALAGTALTVAADTGGVSGPVVDGVADTLRDRIALEREVAALSSQARASAAVLVVAPVVVAVVAAGADERIRGFLLGTPAGWACLVGGLLLDAVGAGWMYVTVRRAL